MPVLGEVYSNLRYCEEHLDKAKELIHAKPMRVKSEKDPWGNREEDVAAIAWYEVGLQLKNLSSAKYSRLADMTIIYSDEKWSASGWVEAENSFGTKVRNTFTVRLKFTDKGEYELLSCTIH